MARKDKPPSRRELAKAVERLVDSEPMPDPQRVAAEVQRRLREQEGKRR